MFSKLKAKALDYLECRRLDKMINSAVKLGFDCVDFKSDDGLNLVYSVTFTNTEVSQKVKMAELYPDSK